MQPHFKHISMKKLLSLVCVAIFVVGAFAQSQHLTFKGVPIDGTLKSYTQKMVEKGFVYEGTQDGIALLSGDFAGQKKCYVAVYTLKGNDLVNMIAVFFNSYDTWSAVLGQYEQLKEMLTEKYGEPENIREEFTTYVGDDSGKLYALHTGEYVWATTFSTDKGDIELSIVEGDEYTSGRVMLRYFDKLNSEKVRQSAMDDL